mgnify:CR=1 FL=1
MVLLPLPGMPINEMILSVATVIRLPFQNRVTPHLHAFGVSDTQCILLLESASFEQRYSYVEGCVTDHHCNGVPSKWEVLFWGKRAWE